MPNPLDYVTQKDIEELGLLPQDLLTAYQPSTGGVYHARGAEGTCKTMFLAHLYRSLIDSGEFTPYDATGNMSFKGKYGVGYTVRKGENLRDYLWNLTHKPYTHKIVIIDEIDSEFPARFYASKEQTEIANRMWHTHKLGNYILESSHIGTSTDLIFMLSSHYVVWPQAPNFETNSFDFAMCSNLEQWYDNTFVAHDIIKTMLIYNRKELTENTEEEHNKQRYSAKQKKIKIDTLPVLKPIEYQEISSEGLKDF